jgi:hypothetical protein
VITTQNAAQCTAFELRQELVRRNAFDLPEEDVNYRTMLKRLMVELVADENQAVAQKTVELEQKASDAREEAKRVREEKKREALERSKQRQADPEYFKRLAELNTKPAKEEASGAPGDAANADANANADAADAESGEATVFDPFRPRTGAQKSKIFVR